MPGGRADLRQRSWWWSSCPHKEAAIVRKVRVERERQQPAFIGQARGNGDAGRKVEEERPGGGRGSDVRISQMRPGFSTTKSRRVSPGGLTAATGWVNVSPGKALTTE